jgi:hypothetical protein
MRILGVPAQLWSLGRKFEDLLSLQENTRKALEGLQTRLSELEIRVTRMEADRDRVVTEARSAAGAAATTVAGSVIAEMVTRLTRLELHTEELARQLPPPRTA